MAEVKHGNAAMEAATREVARTPAEATQKNSAVLPLPWCGLGRVPSWIVLDRSMCLGAELESAAECALEQLEEACAPATVFTRNLALLCHAWPALNVPATDYAGSAAAATSLLRGLSTNSP